MSLSTKYRPTEFNQVMGQYSVIKILDKQIETKTFRNCYIFSGPSGTGKTTLARIMASKINNGKGIPIEIDAASNNSVDGVRQIVESAKERSLDSEYKVYIIDECHSLSNQAWQAFLKCIEEPPKYTIFMFCTTDFHKIPMTIKNRCQIFTLGRISDDSIKSTLNMICKNEGYTYTDESLDYISRVSEGSLRQAITYLDKVKDLSTDITIGNVISALGNYSYDLFFDLTNSKIDGNKQNIVNLIEKIYSDGSDLKLFVDGYLDFILDICKYTIFKSMDCVKIPKSYEEKILYTINIEDSEKFFSSYMDKILNIKQAIKGDSNMKTTIEVMLLN